MKKLALNKETLTELSSDELAQVAGGTHLTCYCPDPTAGIECTVTATFHACATTPVDVCLTKTVATIIG